MALIDREVGVAVAATTALLSPRAREVARKGAVYGLAGVLKVGDLVVGTARGAARGASEGVSGPSGASDPGATTSEEPGGTERAPTAEAAAVTKASETSTGTSSASSSTSPGTSSGATTTP